MKDLRFPVQLRWADMDANFHLRHSVYYDLAAQARVVAIDGAGITNQRMQEGHFGPILFREECVFKREIRLGQKVDVLVRLSKARPDGSRWSFRQEFLRDDGTVCATLTVDGAWIDTKLRRLTVPPSELMEDLLKLPRTEDFEFLPLSSKASGKG